MPTTAPALGVSSWEKLFVLHVDVSKYAVGGTLSQEDKMKRLCVVAFMSKKMAAAEQNYTTDDRKHSGFVHGLRRLCCRLEGLISTVITDNQVVSHFFFETTLRLREAGQLEILADLNFSALQL